MSEDRREYYDRIDDRYLLLCDNENIELESYTAYNHETGLAEMLYRTKIIHTTNPQTIRDNCRARIKHSKSNCIRDYSGYVPEWVEPIKELGLVDELQKETDEWLLEAV